MSDDTAAARPAQSAAAAQVATVKYRLAGFVQGVGFRHYVKKNADALGVFGWARNECDGSLTVLVCGGKEETDKMYSVLMQGPSGSSVASMVELQVEDGDAPAGESFEIY